jgi:hypothetical protein
MKWLHGDNPRRKLTGGELRERHPPTGPHIDFIIELLRQLPETPAWTRSQFPYDEFVVLRFTLREDEDTIVNLYLERFRLRVEVTTSRIDGRWTFGVEEVGAVRDLIVVLMGG